MRYVIENCLIAEPKLDFEPYFGFLVFEGEKIVGTGKGRFEGGKEFAKVIDARGFLLCPSFVDVYADFCEPGFEWREDIRSGSLCAVSSGFTTVFVKPTTDPVCDRIEVAQAIFEKGKAVGLLDVLPLVGMSVGLRQEAMPELGQLSLAGFRWVTNADIWHKDIGFQRRVFEYATNFGMSLVLCGEENSLGGGVAHEGFVSTILGLDGSNKKAETIALFVWLNLCKIAGARVHLAKVSTAEAIKLIREAKEEGLDVTASCAVMNLFFNEESVLSLDTSFKVKPCLRSEEDRVALVQALEEGVIDCVCSDHSPKSYEEKALEFEKALWGAATIEFVFPMLNTLRKKGEIGLKTMLRSLCSAPRKAMGLDKGSLEQGSFANFVISDLEGTHKKEVLSKGKNIPPFPEPLVGNVLLTCNNGRVTYDALGLFQR